MKAQMRRKGRKSKRGASLAMVLISMTVLIIMGTLFTTISMRSYLYSYAKLCKQQAYYTAMSSVESFHSLLKSNPGIIGTITQELNRALDEDINDGIDPTNVTVTIGSTYGGDGSSYVPNGFFDSYMGRCTLRARYANVNRNEISIEANATYKGYSDFARAKIARTNAAASELKKIFDNTFCLQSPISTLIGSVPNGDIYISQPVLPEFVGNDNQPLKDGWQGDYNEVLAALKEYGNYKGYSALPGQYIRDAQGNVIVSGATEEIRNYNTVLRNQLYGDVQASTGNSDLTGHTRTADVDNYPMAKDAGYTYYNDWVELYMFAPVIGSGSGSVNTAVNGNVYANSRVLIGLLDRDKSNTYYPWTWDDTRKRMVYPGDAEAAAWLMGDLSYTDYISAGDNRDNYEHGFDSDVFFDHMGTISYSRLSAQFRVNGNMYLWEDARIENFDSTQTDNARNRIKNNIYAYKNLTIDGTYIEGWHSNDTPIKPADENRYYVTIYGDVIVQGNAQIIGAQITGDVYCFGDELLMVDTTVNGNVYFSGAKFNSDWLRVSGNLIIENAGKNTTYSNYNSGFGDNDIVGRSASSQWGAVLTNTHVYGTLWSDVNTHIVSAKWWVTGSLIDVYNNIYVDGYLFLDGTRQYSEGYYANWGGDSPPGSTYASSYNGFAQSSDDSAKESSVIYADKLQIATSQSRPIVTIDTYELGTVMVGTGGMRIDGYYYLFANSVRIQRLLSVSSANWIYDTRVYAKYNGKEYPDGAVSANADVSTIANRISSGASSIEVALQNLLVQLKNGFGLKVHENVGISQMLDKYFTGTQVKEKIWEGKVINLRKWSAPNHLTKEEIDNGEPGTFYHGNDINNFGVIGFSGVDQYKSYLNGSQSTGYVAHPEAGEVSSDGKTLTIKESVVFAGEADFSSFETVIFDTSGGNIHVRFQDGAVFGKNTVGAGAAVAPSKVVLRGGNMVFFYLEQEENYSMNDPTLIINDGCNFGVVEASQGTNYGNDGLYVISNDDVLIRLAGTTQFNGFVYAPWGHLFIMPGNDGSKNTFNGCMAIESLIVLTDAEEAGTDIISIIKQWWNNLTWGGDESFDPIVAQYANCIYNYVMPPLIVDAGVSFGGTGDEIDDFGQVVWEFMGFY